MIKIKVIFLHLKRFLSECRFLSYIMGKFPSVVIEPRVMFKGDLANLELGQNVQIQSGTKIHLGGMDWCNFAGTVQLGDDSIISPNCVIDGCGPGGVHIGKRFACGPNVSIFSNRTDYTRGLNNHIFEPVYIGDDVVVFANVVISPGVTIGSGAVIAAGAVITDDIPEKVFAGGIPAKIIRENV